MKPIPSTRSSFNKPSSKRAVSWLLLALFAAVLAWSPAACGGDEPSATGCDPAKGDRCACVASDPASCPGGFVCRPSESSFVCEPEGSAGRIPSCLDSAGLDVFAAEADSALSVSWKVNGSIDSTKGFEVRYGLAPGAHDKNVTVGADARRVTLAPLENGANHYVVVAALGASGMASFVSCEVKALPHVLAFPSDFTVHEASDGDQSDPDLASNFDGTRLFLAWEDNGAVALAVSIDFGDGWSETKAVTGSGQNPALAVRDAVLDDAGKVIKPEILYLAWEDGGKIQVASYDPVTGGFAPPVMVASGTNPAIALGLDSLHVVFAEGEKIHHAVSTDGGATFKAPVTVSGALTKAHAPSVAVDAASNLVLAAWDSVEGAGDSNVYSAASTDGGVTFGAPVRIDDDPMGQNQLNVSVAVDVQTGELFATWEDRRGGANLFFTKSADGGKTWAPNVEVGAGLGGDQFHPRAVVDVASNVYVAFHDTTNGQKIVFSRFNDKGTFDPPLAPSSVAGQGGVVGDFPAVATDFFGTVYVAWEENRDGPDLDVVFARAE